MTVRFFFLVLLALSIVMPAMPAPASAAPALQADPCLPGDPYDLDALIEIMSRAEPPTAPVQLNDDLSLIFAGVGEMQARGEDEAQPGPEPRPNPNPSEPPPGSTPYGPATIRAFNTGNQFMFDITMSDRMLRRIHDCREQAGMTSADGGRPGLAPPESRRAFLPLVVDGALTVPQGQQRGWSDGEDTRIVRTPTTLWPWRAIAQQSFVGDDESRCTQTLIGPRHMVTAAHCIVNFGTTSWKTRVLTPGRDGPGISPYGSTTITPNPDPGDTVWYFVPSPWTDPDTTNSFAWDWGLVVVPDFMGNLTGWMGYGAWSANVLNAEDHLNRGYPRCGVANYDGEPAGCQQARLYGDSENCELGDYSDQFADGWNRRISISCDLSKGHSGSAIYHYRYDSNLGMDVPVVTMVASTESCSGTNCDEDDDYPSAARRLAPTDVAVISAFREAFP
jgi:V8-like Glu-specific endopeptidase